MKEIAFKFKIYGFKDLQKWFWDTICFPRRKAVAEWLEYHNSEIMREFENILAESAQLDLNDTKDMNIFIHYNQRMLDHIKKNTEDTTYLILKTK